MTQILAYLHNGSVMLFGILLSAFFLGVKKNRKNVLALCALFVAEGLAYLLCGTAFGNHLAVWVLYPLLIHVPLVLVLTFYYKYDVVASAISVFTAYMCCQISNWVGLFVLALSGQDWCYYLARVITTVVVFFVLCKYVCPTTEVIFAKDRRTLCIIGSLPFVYYVFDCAVTKYSDLLYSSNKAIAEFLGFALCIAYLGFLLGYFQEYEQKQEMEHYGEMMEMQLASIEKEIEQVKDGENALTILRHDMRHHLNVILTLLQSDQREGAVDYIREITDAYEDTEIRVYSDNERLNSVLSIWYSRLQQQGIDFDCEVSVTSKLSCPDLALCTILANGLENASYALEQSPEKWVKLRIAQKNSRIMIQMENPCQKLPRFVDGMPVSGKVGHGIGTRSMVYYVEKLNGQCDFSVQDNRFLLRILL